MRMKYIKPEHESWNTYKYVKSKQHTPEQATGQRKLEKYFLSPETNEKKKNKKPKTRNKQKAIGYCKCCSEREVYSNNVCTRKLDVK